MRILWCGICDCEGHESERPSMDCILALQDKVRKCEARAALEGEGK